MIETLKKVFKVVKAIYSILPAIISTIEDLTDDGKLNESNK